jgi:hypothetical protein
MEAASVAVDAAHRLARLAQAQHAAAEVVEAANEAANDAAAVRIEAQAQAGELLRVMAEHGDRERSGRPGGTRVSQPATPPTLGDLGVTRSESSRWQQLADVPDAVNAAELRHQMRLRGLTAGEITRRARARGHRVSEATISHALNEWRIHPAKLRAIAAVLHDVEPLPGVEGLVLAERPAQSAEPSSP